MNGYICFYKSKKIEVYASTLLEARDKAAVAFKAKRAWEVTPYLAEKNGDPVIHSQGELP